MIHSSIFSKINSLLAPKYLLQNLNKISSALSRQLEIAATNSKYNRASDGPAAYFSIRHLDKKISDTNARGAVLENSINFLQTNSSYLDQVSDILSEMSTLANDALAVDATTAEKVAIQEELNQLRSTIDSILSSGVASKLYTGFSVGGLNNVSLTGTTSDSAQPTLSGLTIDSTNINVTGSMSDITQSITNIENAYNVILRDEGTLGSFVTRLSVEKDSAEIESLNYIASKSTLQDADAVETELEIARLTLLQNTTLSLIAQANSYSSNIISLLY